MKKILIFAAAACMSLATIASAQTATGALSLGGTLEGSVQLTFHQNVSGGIQLTSGDGTSAAVASLSTVSMYGTPNGTVGATNFVKTSQSDGFTLTGTFNVEVDQANLSSTGYNLTAQLASADANTWTLNGQSLSSGSAATVQSGATYGSQNVQTLALKIPATTGAGAVSNTINFTATPQ